MPDTAATKVDPLNTWYSVTPVLSVDAVQAKETLLDVFAVDVKAAGAEGAWVSTGLLPLKLTSMTL
ncbi:hypothetical protein D3C71_1489040 [compost metagenome]